MNSFVKNSPTIVKVGNNKYKIYRDFNKSQAVIQVISKIVIFDEDSGERKIFETPTPGWKFEKYNGSWFNCLMPKIFCQSKKEKEAK